MKTKPTLLSASPLEIERHEFLRIELRAAETDNPSGALALDLRRQWTAANDDPRRWRLVLDVAFASKTGDQPAPYQGHFRIAGCFRVAERYPAERMSQLIAVTGASILYGACREMLANLTARAPHGMVSLPSVSFLDPPVPPPAAPSRKPGPKSNPKRTT